MRTTRQLVTITVGLFIGILAFSLHAVAGETGYAKGELLVKLKASIRKTFEAKDPAAVQASLDALAAKHGGKSMARIFTTAKTKGLLTGGLRPNAMPGARPDPDLTTWYCVKLADDADVNEAAKAFAADANVAYAEPNWEYKLAYELPPIIEGLPDATTDPLYDDQWFHAAAKIPHAWTHLKLNGCHPGGLHAVVVATVDSGVDYDHEDLAGNIWVNSGEIPGNGIDDDQNGFVDDVHGCSVVSDPRSHSGDPRDQHGHGTHVAGIIAAQGYNHMGGIGVAFNVQIMAIRAAQYAGVLTVQDIAEGILYAVDNGADVINMSFGGYARSQIMEDALEVALSHAALIAAAGNDGASVSMYPARLHYVLGVAASTPGGSLAWFSNLGDVKAPGVSIVSTVPLDGYSAWSGTSMATPVVSGIAALMRSYFWQVEIYSSRFNMGCIEASAGEGGVVDAYLALTKPPTPGVSMLENWLFDDEAISARNDGDGRVDAGETIHLAIELMNRSGLAKNVVVTLAARQRSAYQDDPYVTVDVGTVSFDEIGPFNTTDNGFIYNAEGVITGVSNPLVFTVAPDCPNDHVIPFILTITFEDGWNPGMEPVTRISQFYYTVQRGKDIPRIISEDMILTPDEYWIVGGPVLIEPGATLTICPGTWVQWGSISDDPYNPGPQGGYILVRGSLFAHGSQEAPIEFLPSYLVSGQLVTITVDGGTCDLSYVRIQNPNVTGVRSMDHCYLYWDWGQSTISVGSISNTIFHKLRGGGSLNQGLWGSFDTCLFDAGWLGLPQGAAYRDCVFLQDNENNRFLSLFPSIHYSKYVTDDAGDVPPFGPPAYRNGETFVMMPMEHTSLEMAELIANYYGGHVASIRNADEQAFLQWFVPQGYPPLQHLLQHGAIIGMTDEGTPGTYRWMDGSPMTYTNWRSGYPQEIPLAYTHAVYFAYTWVAGWGSPMEWLFNWHNGSVTESNRNYAGRQSWWAFLLRLPGEWSSQQLGAPFANGQMLAYVRANFRSKIVRNAILSRYWDPNVSHWMQVQAPANAPWAYCSMKDNFWGTLSTTLVEHAITDYNDNFTSARVEYAPIPKHGFGSTYPFVERTVINNIPADSVPIVGSGPSLFSITFNRNMDASAQPFVSFGPSPPHTDFVLKPAGGNEAPFTVTLSQASDRPVVVRYVTMNGTAVAGEQFKATRGELVFRPGEVRKTISIPIYGNMHGNDDSMFLVSLSDASNALITDAIGQAVITDDDPTLSVNDITVTEGDAGTTTTSFTVSLSAACSRMVTVEYRTTDGTAKAGTDYQAVSGMLTFEQGQTQKAVDVPIIGNTLNQADRTFSVILSHPTNAEISDAEGVCTIDDDDLLLSVSDAEAVEGNADTVDAVFVVALSKRPMKAITVEYITLDVTAVANSDYVPSSGTLTFIPGDPAEKSIIVPVIGDTEAEGNETFTLQLSNPTNATITDGEAVGTIIGDDGPLFSIDDVSVVEGDTGTKTAMFTVSLSADPVGTVLVDYATVNGTATAGSDYQTAAGTLAFEPGQPLQKSVTVNVIGDIANEADEGFHLNLSGSRYLTDSAVSNGDFESPVTSRTQYLAGTTFGGWTVDTGFAFLNGEAYPGAYGGLQYVLLSNEADGWAGGIIHQDIATVPGKTYCLRFAHGGDPACPPAVKTLQVQFGTAFTDTVSVNVTGNQLPNMGWVVKEYRGLAATGSTTRLTFLSLSTGGPCCTALDEVFVWPEEALDSIAIIDAQGTCTIVNDDPVLSIADVSIIEGNAGTTNAAFTVSLSPAVDKTVTVSYATADGLGFIGSAKAGSDYTATSGTLTFAPGQPTTQTILVPILGDTADEPDETLTLTLSSPTNATIVGGRATGTILNDDAPTLTVDDVQLAEGSAGMVEATFSVTLSAKPLTKVTVDCDTSDGTATATLDYEPASSTLIFNPGEPLVRTFTVRVFGDTDDEPDEDLFINLSNPVGATITDGQGRCFIPNDDIRVSITDVEIVEGNAGSADTVFTVSLSASPANTVTLNYATANGTGFNGAIAGADYTAVSGALTFEPGQPTSQTIAVPILGDAANEPNEWFTVDLSGAVNAVIAKAAGKGTIIGDEGLMLSIADVSVREFDAGTTYARIPVTLSGDPGQRVTVQYATTGGTATLGVGGMPGTDFRLATGTLVFDPGQPLSQDILVPITGDLATEPDETFFVDLSNGTVAVSDSRAVVTILDDDRLLNVSSPTVVEGLSGTVEMIFAVSVSGEPFDTITVDYETADANAVEGVDYLGSSGPLTFGPGLPLDQDITVYVLCDITNEADETLLLKLLNPVNAALGVSPGVGTIIDDDGPKFVITGTTVAEGDAGTVDATFTISLTEAWGEPASVTWTAADGTAISGADYVAASGTLTFEPGQPTQQTVVVQVKGDIVDELNEYFVVKLSNGSLPINGADGACTITDDDEATISISDVVVAEGYNGWVNSRTWEGSFWVTPVTGDGYHLMRISDAVAADDPWLVSGYDVGRFRFKVEAMTAQSMNLQASGGEGCINLTWIQDDYDLLAGYNLYRSAAIGGTYEKINATIVPVGSERYTDTNVQPAVPMYYKFTVILTDMTESTFSNVASAAAVDTVPPVLTHTPVTSAVPSRGLRIAATATDNVGVASVTLYFRATGTTSYATMAMVNTAGNEWSATIPGSSVLPPGLEYYLKASDGISEVYHGTPAAPHSVVVSASPSIGSVTPGQGPVTGGTPVTVSGTLFQTGASVLFGGVPALNVSVLTENQITCTSPPHFPAQVDVKVVNPDATEATMLNAFRYVDTGVVLSMPTLTGDYATMVDVPLSISNVTGLRAADITITFNSAVLAARSVQNGALTFGWAMIASINTAGHVVLSMAGGTAVAGNGPIAVIRFEVIGHPPADTPLTIGPALLNDGAITCTLSHGSFTVRGLFNISGTVSYCTGGGPVPGVAMSLVGVGTHSGTADGAGAYAFADVPTGSYTLTPNKADGVAEITAYDASLVLQKAAGLISLSANQTLAADVNRNGSVTSMDASYILEASVGLIEPPFPGAGRVWLFVPETRSYALLNANQTGQNFTGILIGDVSGNWSPPPGAPEASFSEVVSLTLPAGRTLPGHSVMLPLRVEQCGQHVYSTDIALQYDPAVLSVSSVTPGNAAAGMAFACNTTQPGLIRAGIAGAQPLLQDGSLMEVTCEVHGSLASPTAVTFQRARINEGNVPASVVNGTVSSVYPGDANLDCRTNVLDLIFIRNRLNAETNTADNWQADVNQDGRINVLDLIYVRNRLNTSCE